MIEERDVEIQTLMDNEEFHTKLKEDMEQKVTTITQLRADIQDHLSENSRLRTENVNLKNKGKVVVNESRVVGNTTKVQAAEVRRETDLTETVLALTEAVEMMNNRLERQEKLLSQPAGPSLKPIVPPRPNVPKAPKVPARRNTLPPPVLPVIPPKMNMPPPPPPPPIFPSLQPSPSTSTSAPVQPLLPPRPTLPFQQRSATAHTFASPSAAKSRVHTTLIVSDSMPTKINMSSIKSNINVREEGVIFKKFPGHTAEEISFYAPKPLSDHKPDRVVVIAGTNDLTRAMYEKSKVNEYQVVESILKIGRAARDQGAKKIYLSSIVVRRGYYYREAVNRVNDLLYMACLAEDFLYLDHSMITMDHISSDGIHPNEFGAAILKFNILSVFDSFRSELIDFREEYERAVGSRC